jgi:asparagine synthase (glutamine-hydrolysing)
MCGIAGRVSLRREVDPGALGRAAALLRHRGPDGSGDFVKDGVALVHTRLAIVDLAGGAQPMTNEDGRVVVVCNGEIYNHADLRAELEPRGHVFRTRCDTEAIVHGYEVWQAELPQRLRGMFALAVWDQERRRLLLARDRLGIKPIYYAELRGGDVVFASDLRALFAWPDVPRDLDEQAIQEYLALRYVPAPRTALGAVRKLPPGCCLFWQDGRVEIQPYWDLPTAAPPPRRIPTLVEAAMELRRRIDESVRLRLMADVPLGVFLSGGVDSSVVTAAMARQVVQKVQSFAVGFAGPESELAWARLAAHAIGTEHHELIVGPGDVTDELSHLVRRLDEPVADTAAVPLYFLARLARRHVKVILSGEGGDEAFAGYVTYARQLGGERVRAALGRLAGAGTYLLPWLDRDGAPLARLRRLARLCALPLEERYIGVARALDSRRRAAVAALAPHWQRSRGLSPLRRMLYLDTRVFLPDDLLVKADKMTMAHALELRVPLLDHQLLEWAWTLPDRYVLGKRLLKQAARGRVPPAILERPKSGFANPIERWLRTRLRPLARDLLLGPSALRPLGRGPTETLLLAHERGAPLGGEMWALLVLELWRREVPGVPMRHLMPADLEAAA